MPPAERLAWTPAAWEVDLDWQGQDRNQHRRINQLSQACLPDAVWGIGKLESLRETLPVPGQGGSKASIASSTGRMAPRSRFLRFKVLSLR